MHALDEDSGISESSSEEDVSPGLSAGLPDFAQAIVSMKNFLDPEEAKHLLPGQQDRLKSAVLDCCSQLQKTPLKRKIFMSYPWPFEAGHHFYTGFQLRLIKCEKLPNKNELEEIPTLCKLTYFKEKSKKKASKYYLYAPLKENLQSWNCIPLGKKGSKQIRDENKSLFEKNQIFISPEENKFLYDIVCSKTGYKLGENSQKRYERYERYKNCYIPFVKTCLEKMGFDVYLDQFKDAPNKNFAEEISKQLSNGGKIKVICCLSPLYEYKMQKSKHILNKENTIFTHLWFNNKLDTQDICPIYFEKTPLENKFTPLSLGTSIFPCEKNVSLEDDNFLEILYKINCAVKDICKDSLTEECIKSWNELIEYASAELSDDYREVVEGITEDYEKQNETEREDNKKKMTNKLIHYHKETLKKKNFNMNNFNSRTGQILGEDIKPKSVTALEKTSPHSVSGYQPEVVASVCDDSFKNKNDETIAPMTQVDEHWHAPRSNNGSIRKRIEKKYLSSVPKVQMTLFFRNERLPLTTSGEANCGNADFSQLSLEDSMFDKTCCENANFESSNLTRASFDNANCINAVFSKATLKETCFSNAKLDGAWFSGAKKLKAKQLKDANFNTLHAEDDKTRIKLEYASLLKKSEKFDVLTGFLKCFPRNAVSDIFTIIQSSQDRNFLEKAENYIKLYPWILDMLTERSISSNRQLKKF